MSRVGTILQSEHPYYISGRCINKDWFDLPRTHVWNIMSDHLFFLHHAFDIKIHSFVLLEDHFRLLITTPSLNLDKAMAWFMKQTSVRITRSAGRINQTYCRQYFRCIITRNHHFELVYKYIYYEAVKEGLCDRPEDYSFSTLHGLLGNRNLFFPVTEDRTLFRDVGCTLDWLNRAPTTENWEAVRKALKKQFFRLAPVNSKPHALEIDAL